MRIKFTYSLLMLGLVSVLHGQHTANFPGFAYQVVLRDAEQRPLANQTVQLKVTLRGQHPGQLPFYQEEQILTTNEEGLMSMVIGEGQDSRGDLQDLPWAEDEIWLELTFPSTANQALSTMSTRLMAVPYAVYAASTNKLVDFPAATTNGPEERNQSIYWTTSGNNSTNSNVHFLGTRDNAELVFKTNNRTTMTLTNQGRLLFYNFVPSGTDDDINDYPVVIGGSLNTQGVWVKLNVNRRGIYNFVTFADPEGIQGQIEGQTLLELENSPLYLYEVALAEINAAALGGKIAELALKATGEAIGVAIALALVVPTFGATASSVAAQTVGVTATGVKIDATIVELASYLTATASFFNQLRSKVGVAYKSGSGDYAEWLPRDPKERDLVYGEIVGVKDGQISLNTDEADHCMVISRYPAFLGKDDPDQGNVNQEMVAFIGQVPVRIAGMVHSGDYIVPSGKNDGFGIAIAPESLNPDQISKIVGVAWENGHPNLMINIVKVGVGIKSDAAMATTLASVESKVNTILEKLGLPQDDMSTPAKGGMPESAIGEDEQVAGLEAFKLSDEQAENLLRANEPFVRSLFEQVQQKLDQDGVTYKGIGRLTELFDDPVATLVKIRKNPNYLIGSAFSR